MIARPNAVLSLLIKHFGSTIDDSLTREEIHLAGRLKTILEQSYQFGVEVDSKEEAVLDIDGDDFQWMYDDEHLPPAKYDGVLDLDEITFGEFKVTLGKVKEAINYYRSAKTGRRSLESMSNRFRFLKNEHHIRKLKQVEEDLKSGDIRMNRLDGLAKIAQLLLEDVKEKDEKGFGMHDIDLQQMALQINDEGKFVKDFKASDTWLLNFKRAHNIGGRHVTKFVTMRNYVDSAIKKKEGEDFVERVKQIVIAENIPPECVLNADQSGIQKNLVSKRTLTFLGSKRVDRVVDAVTATTHSFTVMPTISANGDLGEVLYVNLSEPNGLPARGHYQAANLVVTARKSHMKTKDLAGVWLEKCVAPYVSNKVLLVLDSWPAFKDVDFIKSKLPANTTVIVKTTRLEQLDLCSHLMYFSSSNSKNSSSISPIMHFFTKFHGNHNTEIRF